MMAGALLSRSIQDVRAKPQAAAVRVCFMIDRLSRAGTETQLLALIRSLDRSRVSPHLVLLDGEDNISRSLEPEDCPTLRLGLHSLLRPSTMSAAVRLRRFWRQRRIDIVQTYFLDSTYFGVPLARLCGVEKVIRVRNNLGYWLTNGHRRLGRWMGRLADLTLTNSESGKAALVEAESLRPDKVAVLENGVDLDRFRHPEPPDTGRAAVRVGLVGNLRPVKNIDGLIHAAAQLRLAHPHIRFEVAGDGEQRPGLERLIAEHNLQGTFQLLGAVGDVPGFLGRQDIAVLCSHSEGMSNALLEYMASGRAIVATDVGANGRLIHDAVHGLIVPANDEAALVSAFARLIAHPDWAREMAAAARKRVQNEYSRTAMVNRFEDFYEQLLSPLAASR
jgi:glycosyltransferase involved in cell wall biosynthesis